MNTKDQRKNNLPGFKHSTPLTEKKIFVTGADGFIGRQAIQPLHELGFDVHALCFDRTKNLPPHATWHYCDLLDQSAVTSLITTVKPTHLLHFAWYAEHGKFWTSEKNFLWVDMSMHLLRTFHEQGGSRAVFTGSCAEYDWSVGHCNEKTTPRDPKTVYGICKDVLFRLASAYSQAMGISFAWGRIFFAYGPFEDPRRLVPLIISALLNNISSQCHSGSHIRDFMHSSDIGRAFAALSNSDFKGAINIGSGIPYSLAEVVNVITEQFGHRGSISISNTAPSPENPAILTADTAILNKILNFTPRLNLQQGIADTIAWWHTNLENRLS